MQETMFPLMAKKPSLGLRQKKADILVGGLKG